jgi:phosphoribosylcarboxyaminoimidazole (NCAIR) mutase
MQILAISNNELAKALREDRKAQANKVESDSKSIEVIL